MATLPIGQLSLPLGPWFFCSMTSASECPTKDNMLGLEIMRSTLDAGSVRAEYLILYSLEWFSYSYVCFYIGNIYIYLYTHTQIKNFLIKFVPSDIIKTP